MRSPGARWAATTAGVVSFEVLLARPAVSFLERLRVFTLADHWVRSTPWPRARRS